MTKSLSEQRAEVERIMSKAPFVEPMAVAAALRDLIEYLDAEEQKAKSFPYDQTMRRIGLRP